MLSKSTEITPLPAVFSGILDNQKLKEAMFPPLEISRGGNHASSGR